MSKLRPLLFTGPMVRAILQGRKTQTRRLKLCGLPGNQLWVRETFASGVLGCESQGGYSYRADHNDPRGDGPANPMKWTPSIFMPFAAARIFLRITSVREELLRRITEADAEAEGVLAMPRPPRSGGPSFVASYKVLWDQINGTRAPWASNPMVYVTTFERICPCKVIEVDLGEDPDRLHVPTGEGFAY